MRASRILFLAPALLACAPDATGPRPIDDLPRPLTSEERDVVATGNAFAWSWFRRVSTADPNETFFISPLSASMALGMTMNGAAGETLDAMRRTLGFEGIEEGDVNTGYRSLIELLRTVDPRTDFRIANSVWHRLDFPAHQTFIDTVGHYFDATIDGLDFTDPAALATINGWVERSTAGHIPEILESIDPNHLMFLINAIYFKSNWRTAFNRAETRDAPFLARNGSTQTAKLMHVRSEFPYLETRLFRAVDLPYGNTAFSMTLVVPFERATIDEVTDALTETAWATWMEQLATTEVEVYLPKLRLEYDRFLNADLTAMGMGIAFEPGAADFSRISPVAGGAYIDFVRQKTFVEIDEAGTTAAAATVVALSRSAGPPEIRADRPYIIVLRERFSGTILFIGKIQQLPPTA